MGISIRSWVHFEVFLVLSSFTITSLGKRELVALLLLCSECHVAVIFLLTLPCGPMSVLSGIS